MKTKYTKYKESLFLNTSKEQILLMMYEGAIKFTKLALEAENEKNTSLRSYNIMRAYDIILELQNSLDHKKGGEITKHLDPLYSYILEQYTKANLYGNLESLNNSLEILEKLQKSWNDSINSLKVRN